MRYLSLWVAMVILLPLQGGGEVDAFRTPSMPSSSSSSSVHRVSSSYLYMAGSKSLKSKQAALRQKMEQAKRQKEEPPSSFTDEEIRQRNDRLRFAELLQRGGGALSSDGTEYLNRKQEEEEIDAVRKFGDCRCIDYTTVVLDLMQ